MRKIAGIDEAGRGPLAGPVVAAAVVFQEGYSNPKIKDSKKLSAKQREELIEIIQRDAVDFSIIAVGHHRIHQLNIRGATKLAMSLALRRVCADIALIDGNMEIDSAIPQTTIIKGDALRVEISAASILAKTYRDKLMKTLDNKYPGYGFERHAGYPTSSHREAIAKLGPSSVHRIDFAGVKEFIVKKSCDATLVSELQLANS